jgi:hypothetical protein
LRAYAFGVLHESFQLDVILCDGGRVPPGVRASRPQ